ncbi:putative skeletal organic matrix protein 2 [Oculina patagonica]
MVLHQQVLYSCGQAILFWSAVQLSKEIDLPLLLLETPSVSALKLGVKDNTENFNMKLFLLMALFVANDVAASPAICNECLGSDEASCSAQQKDDQFCATDRDSLGTTHCATAVGKYQDDISGNVSDVFFRGCFDCASKKEACFALGGFLKGDEHWTLLQCEIECCTSVNCNTQVPTLSENAITVFTPNVSGPGECYGCFESGASSCDKGKDQTCATDGDSLGTTHCGSAVGKYRDEDGKIQQGFWRGCINCEDKKAACAAIGGFLKDEERWSLLQCEIECCTGRKCNPQVPTLPSTSKKMLLWTICINDHCI